MRKKDAIAKRIYIIGISMIILTACTYQNETDYSIYPTEMLAEESRESEESRKEIPIESPIGTWDEYILTLVPSNQDSGTYDLKLCDKTGQILQLLPCGELKEPIRFSYDNLTYGYSEDLQIFSADSQTGLFFAWTEDLFEEAIEIPKYDEVRERGFMASKEDGEYQVNTIYQVNEARKRVEEVRRWSMHKDTGKLKIRDCMEQKLLFDGDVKLDENGNLMNEKYYQRLFWGNQYLVYDYTADSGIPTWVDEPRSHTESAEQEEESQEVNGFEYVQDHVFGNKGHMAEYEDRQTLLAEFGFGNKDPMYQYYDEYDNLQLELYLDKEAEKGCGIAYSYRFTSDLEKIVKLYGFTISTIWEGEGEAPDPFSLKSVYGTDGADRVRDYEERFKYTKDGKLDFYQSQGITNWYNDERDVIRPLLEFDYIYRDDGTLFYRHYFHSPQQFGTTSQSMSSYYDETERVLYESGYITHGSYEYYYIYENDNIKPTYRLGLDYNGGYSIPELVRYQ